MCIVRKKANLTRSQVTSYIHTYECEIKNLIPYFARHTYMQHVKCEKDQILLRTRLTSRALKHTSAKPFYTLISYIVNSYVQVRNHFIHSFRTSLTNWLQCSYD